MKSYESSGSDTKERSYRMPADLGFLEHVRMSVIARRAEALDTGDFVNSDGTRRASVKRGVGSTEITTERENRRGEQIRTTVDLAYMDFDTIPHISADQIRFRITPEGTEEVLASGHYSASNQHADNTLGLDRIEYAMHVAKQLQSGDPA